MPLTAPPARGGRRRSGWSPRDAAFVADWRPTLFVHFRLAPEVLAREVPAPLDLYDGCAYVTLVLFRLERMRRAGWGPLGRWLCRPISEHPFLNLRTYVRGSVGPGIQFLVEWIPNRLSLAVGPRVYGLPYRLGRFSGDGFGPEAAGRLRVEDPALAATLTLEFGRGDAPLAPCPAGSLAEFLLERDVAYTERRGVHRYFRVRHEPWQMVRPDYLRCNSALAAARFPWFRGAEFAGAHWSPGVTAVDMGKPWRL